MFKKLQKILLIDDSESDNFIHLKKIRKADVTEEIVVTYSAQEALDYLSAKSEHSDDYPRPELVFLDINMPGMNGWDFLDEYDKLDENMKANVVITMLTTSISDTDREIAMQKNIIKAYENKPLTESKLWTILETHFPERMEENQ